MWSRKEYLAITPEGDIYPCHQFVGNEDYKLSNIMNEEIVFPHDLTDSFKNAHVYSKEDCKKCWNKFYCSGGVMQMQLTLTEML